MYKQAKTETNEATRPRKTNGGEMGGRVMGEKPVFLKGGGTFFVKGEEDLQAGKGKGSLGKTATIEEKKKKQGEGEKKF